MKVLHILDHSLPIHSGYSFRSAAIFRGQQKLGLETVHLTTPRYNVPESDHLTDQVDDLTFHRTVMPAWVKQRGRVIRQLAEIYLTTRRIVQLGRAEKVDILHAHSPILDAIPALFAKCWLKVPVIYEIRAFWEDAAVDLGRTNEQSTRYKLTQMAESCICRLATRVTTICQGLQQDLIKRGIKSSKITIIPNAVDIARFQQIRERDPQLCEKLALQDAPTVGFFGSFYSYEGLDLLVDAIVLVKEQYPNVKLILVGGGPQESLLKDKVHDLNLSSNVVIAGRVPNSEIHRYYSLANMVAFPRRSMRLTELVTPLKPLEAMALGVPVIASRVGGHAELIKHDSTGILFEAESVSDLAASIIRLIESESLQNKLVENGRRFVESERTWESSTARYQSVYANLNSGA